MDDWKPKPDNACDFSSLDLDESEVFVLTHVDGSTPVETLSRMTGLSEDQVAQALDGLVEKGAVVPSAPQGEPPSGDPGALAQSARGFPDEDEPTDPDIPASAPPATRSAGPTSSLPNLAGEPPSAQTPEPEWAQPPDPEPAAEEPEEPDPDPERDSAGASPERSATYRRLFEQDLRPLTRDQRAALAGTAMDDVLCALCFDPDPMVIHAVLKNMQTDLTHARLIAEHHHNPAGLEALGRKVQFARDAEVKRRLFRNNQTPEALFRKILEPLPLVQVFKFNLGREATERAKRLARQVLRQKFQRGQAEEKVGLIFNTEGRCLNLLVGLHLDQKTTALLCRRTYNSSLLIQSFARFPATPPKLIAHLLKQPVVKRQAPLKQMLQRHSNCPGSLKR